MYKMVINKISKGVIKLSKDRGIDFYDTIKKRYVTSIIAYLINSKYRNTLIVKNWLKDSLSDISPKLQIIAAKIQNKQKLDEQMIEILKWVVYNIVYTGDTKQYSRGEYWAKAEETAISKKGDCEDGAILMYSLARIKGIPANRMFLWCGDMKDVGHCCLFYKPTEYPFNWVYLDWCYYPSVRAIAKRNLLNLIEKEIYEYTPIGWPVKSQYKRTWFLFNENDSFSKIRYKKF